MKTTLTLSICTDLTEATVDGGIRPTAHGKGRKVRKFQTFAPPRYVAEAPLKEWAAGCFREYFPEEPDLEALDVVVKWYRYA